MEKLFQSLSEKALILTPNNRLSAILFEKYFIYKGKKPIEKPPCFPYSTFLTNSYAEQENEKSPILLSMMQCQYLWRQCLKAQDTLPYSEGLLNAVMDAWRNCLLWRLSNQNPSFAFTPQTQQFQAWWQHFDKKLEDLQAITEYQIVDFLIKSQYRWPYKKVIWVSFDSFTPQQCALQNYFTQHNIEQIFYELPHQNEAFYQFKAENPEAEREQLRLFLEEKRNQNKEPIAVVVPNLQDEAKTLSRYLKKFISPDLFNISLGIPLYDYPLVNQAYLFLTLENEILNHEAKVLLLSPYLQGAQKEFVARAECIEKQTLLQMPKFHLHTWIDLLKITTPVLANLLEKLKPYPQSAPVLEWVELFKNRLQQLGFPGNTGLDSEQYQCFVRFQESFNDFAELGFITETMSKKEALLAFKNILIATIFQAQAAKPKPIQILGLLEASGCPFESVWIMGLTDLCLPEKTRLSPFIPQEIQRKQEMPHSLPAKELSFSLKLIERFKAINNEAIFSYPALSADTTHLPSPLIKSFPSYSPKDITGYKEKPTLELNQESYLLPLFEGEETKGGTQILANQAKCPFKAFARHRLHLKPRQEISYGISALEKGQLVHKIMENIWQKLSSQNQLLSYEDEKLEALINTIIQESLEGMMKSQKEPLPLFIQAIERQKLNRLIKASLDWERKRPSFYIHAIEKSYTIQLAGLSFHLRMDRLDAIADDKTWVIDYKSSLPQTNPWNEERPKEPQLLLYALLDESIHGLLFLELKGGKATALGFCDEPFKIEGIRSPKKGLSWEEHKKTWYQQLEALATEFKDGFCEPQPQTSVCMLCDYKNLCRSSS